jgi:hypothetical protein
MNQGNPTGTVFIAFQGLSIDLAALPIHVNLKPFKFL